MWLPLLYLNYWLDSVTESMLIMKNHDYCNNPLNFIFDWFYPCFISHSFNDINFIHFSLPICRYQKAIYHSATIGACGKWQSGRNSLWRTWGHTETEDPMVEKWHANRTRFICVSYKRRTYFNIACWITGKIASLEYIFICSKTLIS